ncbi:hypothetical protein E2C01_075206 [Portunus trituberculatus]|uniref:Uncharacterized protein n=1 Tax=Portunus trituberculatus TaxID=210409 RepID=A0A5B7IEF1_PORTR|nr:hypothetical protein [Portunus trituberculatus]
MTETVLAQWR